ncbi:Fis family transcriptional regulator [Spirochaetia bacterium]|nr:Fis family transcriptional regulator [Spirochaetia bacterium]
MLSTVDVRKFNTLIEINTLINSHYDDARVLLTQIVDSAARLCEAGASSLLLLDKQKKELHFELAFGTKGAEVKKFTLKSNEGIAGWVTKHNKSIIINDVKSDKRHQTDIPKRIGYACETMLAVPMRIKDECIGVIELLNKKGKNGFTQDDLEWLEIFANQAALALVNARSIEQARNRIELLQDEIKNERGYHELVAKSPVILEKLEIIDRVARTDSSVLILGESGVGKELFAEQIHIRSKRNKAPFVRINCAALPEGLLESELFGHVKGAFTSAVANRRGRFELANGGTIFLDEIGDMPLSLQAKLLRVIQERTFEKVGSETSIMVDVRILAATNKDIEDMVERGEFRSDLYYRLNVLPLYIPPLRQRPEDIPELAAFFLRKYIKETKKNYEGFSSAAMNAMLSYLWPGNVRELENCVERACTIGKDPWIGEEDLFLKGSRKDEGAGEGNRNLKEALNAFKAHYITKNLEENNWNQTNTARALDIQRTYLSRLIKDLNIIIPKE